MPKKTAPQPTITKPTNTKRRAALPKSLENRIKVEFRHRCALCRAPYAEVHHIDENPSNNAASNLIPLCPNCHHGRAHGRGGHRIDAGALSRYKALGLRFAATGPYDLLLRRFAYLTNGSYAEMDLGHLITAFQDLTSFVRGLNHGGHFADMLKRRAAPPQQRTSVRATFIGGSEDVDSQMEQHHATSEHLSLQATEEYRAKLALAIPGLADLLDEILMAQDVA